METYSHEDIAALEQTNWWYVSRRRLLTQLLKAYAPRKVKSALDLGCGVGSNIALLSPLASERIGLDISSDALVYAKRREYTSFIEGSATAVPLPDDSIDLVLCTDVLEHVDDAQALREIHRVLAPGGIVAATVPGFMSLWNENDDYSHHLRRYGHGELQRRFVERGFELHYVNFWNVLMVIPTWIAARLYRKKTRGEKLRNNLTRIPGWMNGILLALLTIERAVGAGLSMPFGVSRVVIARKPLRPHGANERR